MEAAEAAVPSGGAVHAAVPANTAAAPLPAHAGAAMVPGWWLAVATILGSATTVAGTVLVS